MTLIHKEGENMNIQLPIKIHNKFEIEVKDITTGEIVQKGYAENIVLNKYFTSANVHNSNKFFAFTMHFGEGTGTLDASRTTLFDKIDKKNLTKVAFVVNQPPLPSYATKKVILAPAEYVGKTITEVGLGLYSTEDLFTHALIKDSEGNSLELGPKTDTQEITIYATVYFVPDFEEGITLYNASANSMVSGFVGWDSNQLRGTVDNKKPGLSINNAYPNKVSAFAQDGPGKLTINYTLLTSDNNNEKIKTITIRGRTAGLLNSECFTINLETLAENNSSIWGGWEFDNTPIGIGDDSTTVFNLNWDEAWLAKPKKVYVNGVEAVSGFTFNAGNITFNTAPADQAVITADYWVKYCPKDIDHELRINLNVSYGEGV